MRDSNDHISLAVDDYEKSRGFVCKALAPLGVELIMEIQGWAGLSTAGKPEFWFGMQQNRGDRCTSRLSPKIARQLRDFYRAALAACGSDNGAPGIREHYHPNYYGAFVIGPDGHNIEAVCHQPEA